MTYYPKKELIEYWRTIQAEKRDIDRDDEKRKRHSEQYMRLLGRIRRMMENDVATQFLFDKPKEFEEYFKGEDYQGYWEMKGGRMIHVPDVNLNHDDCSWTPMK